MLDRCAPIIGEVEWKAEVLSGEYPRRIAQPVLVVDGPVSKEVKATGYVYKVIEARDLGQ